MKQSIARMKINASRIVPVRNDDDIKPAVLRKENCHDAIQYPHHFAWCTLSWGQFSVRSRLGYFTARSISGLLPRFACIHTVSSLPANPPFKKSFFLREFMHKNTILLHSRTKKDEKVLKEELRILSVERVQWLSSHFVVVFWMHFINVLPSLSESWW